MTAVEDLLCRCSPSTAGFALAGLWCLPSLLFECVVCGGVWVVLWWGLKLATGYIGSEASWNVQEKVSCCLCLAGAT